MYEYLANVICSLSYPAWNAHATYCHLWPARIYNIFTHYLIKGRILEKKNEYLMCVLIFSISFIWNISYSNQNQPRYDHTCIFAFKQSTCHSCPILMKLEFPLHILEKYSKAKFHENPFIESWVVLCGRSDGRTPFPIVRKRIK